MWHMMSHNGEKPFKCNLCVLDCGNEILLKHHMMSHTLRKPFECKECYFEYDEEIKLMR